MITLPLTPDFIYNFLLTKYPSKGNSFSKPQFMAVALNTTQEGVDLDALFQSLTGKSGKVTLVGALQIIVDAGVYDGTTVEAYGIFAKLTDLGGKYIQISDSSLEATMTEASEIRRTSKTIMFNFDFIEIGSIADLHFNGIDNISVNFVGYKISIA